MTSVTPDDRRLTRHLLGQHGPYGLLALSASGLLGGKDAGRAAGCEIPLLDWIVPFEPLTLDAPHALDGGSLQIVPNILEKPFALDARTGKLKPALATGHRVLDQRTIVLAIRRGVRFHDGSPLTAEDVAFSLGRHLDRRVGSLYAPFFASVRSFEATGPHEVTVALRRPDAGVLPTLGTIAAFVGSKAFIERHGGRTGTPAVGTVGTGPYRFVSWESGRRLTLERFESYWNREGLPLAVKRFQGRVVADPDEQVRLLETGEVDGIDSAGLSGTHLRRLLRDPGLEVANVSFPGALSLVLNSERPPFDDVRARRAVAHALDRETLLGAVQLGQGTLTKSVAPPATWSFERKRFAAAYEALEGYDYDPTKARQLVASAGVQGAEGELWALPPHADLAEAVKHAAHAAGLNLRVRVVGLAQFAQEAAGATRSYAALLTIFTALYPDPGAVLAAMYASDGPANASGYRNVDIDGKLRLQSGLAADPARRAKLLIDVQSEVTRDCPCIPLWTYESPAVFRQTIGGFVPNPYENSFIGHLSSR